MTLSVWELSLDDKETRWPPALQWGEAVMTPCFYRSLPGALTFKEFKPLKYKVLLNVVALHSATRGYAVVLDSVSVGPCPQWTVGKLEVQRFEVHLVEKQECVHAVAGWTWNGLKSEWTTTDSQSEGCECTFFLMGFISLYWFVSSW